MGNGEWGLGIGDRDGRGVAVETAETDIENQMAVYRAH